MKKMIKQFINLEPTNNKNKYLHDKLQELNNFSEDIN